ncbi:MAG: hypothetical protein NZ578_05060 [Candidatus Binatia bacterium]|nr:hypothetical protein [Candidatus Binatia bacterium]MDW8252343.1 hypothetical protein [Chloroflexota bacterium]
MATYWQWTNALVKQVLAEHPRGAPIYLHVDDDRIQEAGAEWASPGRDLVSDFCRAVAQEVRASPDGNRISLAGLRAKGDHDRPPAGVGFLALLTLTASRMAADEQFAENNFFSRFRQLLGLTTAQQGRPKGFASGDEEPLWQNWNRWLAQQGYQPTARGGADGPTRFIGYALSQILLSQAHKARLHRLFAQKQWTDVAEPLALFERVRREVGRDSIGSAYLEKVLVEVTGARRTELAEAIYEVYEAWRENPTSQEPVGQRGRTSQLNAGLYRHYDPFDDTVAYRLYPRIARNSSIKELAVFWNGRSYDLTLERPGRLMPDVPISVDDLERLPLSIPATDPSGVIRTVVLPKREFFLLVPDPDFPEAGVFATWGAPRLGDYFVLLCREELLDQLEQLAHENIVRWNGDPVPMGNGWVELRECRVLRDDWSHIYIQNADLASQLRPSERVSISLSGGLHLSSTIDWIQGHGPYITVYSFRSTVQVTIKREGELIDEFTIGRDQPKRLESWWSKPGIYEIQACSGSDQADQRYVRIISLDEIAISPVQQPIGRSIGNATIYGALVEEVP